jgi:hypothetical protein
MRRIPAFLFFFILLLASFSYVTTSNHLAEVYGIGISPIWEGIPRILEDDDPHIIQITGSGGMLEGNEIDDLKIWNQENRSWSSYNETSIFNASIVIDEDDFHVKITPLPDQFGSEEILLNLLYNNTYEEFFLLIEVDPVNDPPQLFFPSTSPPRTFFQYSNYSIQPIVMDPDPDDIHVFDINFNHSIEGKQSIIDQLSYYYPNYGEDWVFNSSNGRFKWFLKDQNIWKNGSQMVDEVEVEFTFWVSDLAGATDSFSYSRSFFDKNDAPSDPINIHIQSGSLYSNHEIAMWTDPISDPDLDDLTYKWDFGDGHTGSSMNVNHTYLTKGWRIVQLWVSDGEFETDKIQMRIEILDEPEEEVEPSEERGDNPSSEGISFYTFLTAGIVLFIWILIIGIAFVVIRKRKDPNE